MTDDVQANGQEPTPEAGQAPAGQQTEQTFDAAYVKQLRQEAAKYRKEAQEAQAKVQNFEAAQMTESQRAKAEADAAKAAALAAQTELRKARGDVAIAREAVKHGVDPALLAKLVDLEFDDSGAPVNVDSAVVAVLNSYPQLKPAAPAPGATNPGRKSALTMDAIKRMSAEEINARWDEVSAVMEAAKH